MAYWIAIDAARDSQDGDCILGIFTDEAMAQAVLDDHKRRYKAAYRDDSWSREFVVYCVEELNTPSRVDYKSDDPWQSNPFKPRIKRDRAEVIKENLAYLNSLGFTTDG